MRIDLSSSQPVIANPSLAHLLQSQESTPPKYNFEQVKEITQGLFDAFTQGLSTESKNAQTREYLDRSAFMSMVKDFQGISGAVAAFARPEVANQINVISSHVVNIGLQVAGLAECGPLALEGAVTPIGFVTSCLTAIGHISNLFRRSNGITIERATFDAICSVSKQIHQLQAEMNRRFDGVQFQISIATSDILIQFGLLHKKTDHLGEILEQIQEKMRANNIGLQHALSSISQSITDLGQQFTDQVTRDAVGKIVKPIKSILRNVTGGHMTDDRFTKVSNQLVDDIAAESKLKEIAGPLATLPDKDIAQWQPMKHSPQWAYYHVNPIRAFVAELLGEQLRTSVSNPLLICYSTLALLLINYKRYTTSPDPLAQHISGTELDEIRTVATEVEATQEALLPLRNPDIYVRLLQQIKQSLVNFQTEYRATLETFQKTQSQDIELKTETALTKRQEASLKLFSAQVIEPDWHGGPEWFLAYRNTCGEGISYTYSLQTNSPGGQPTASYAATVRDTHVKTIKDKILVLNQKYKELGAHVIYPAKDYQGPLLPITPALVAQIIKQLPAKTQHAIELNALQVMFRYFTKDNREFHLQAVIEETVCYELSLPYQMPLYKPGESEWLFWVGGFAPTGNTHDPVVLSDKQHHKKHTYDFTFNVRTPILEERNGYITHFNPTKHVNIALTAELNKIEAIADQRNTEIYKALRKQFNTDIRDQFVADKSSILGIAITAFDAQFKKLKALIALAYPDAYAAPGPLSHLLHEMNIPTSRTEFLAYLQDNPSQLGDELFEKIRDLINLYEQQLLTILTHLNTTIPNQLLETVAMEVDNFIRHFERIQVPENPIAPIREGLRPHDSLREAYQRIALLEAKLYAVSGTVRGLPPEQAQAFVESTEQRYNTILETHPHLRQAASAVSALPNSVVDLIVRSGSPVFRAARSPSEIPAITGPTAYSAGP